MLSCNVKRFGGKVSRTFETKDKNRPFEKLHDKPCWIWNAEEHKTEDIRTNGDLFLNHIIGFTKEE